MGDGMDERCIEHAERLSTVEAQNVDQTRLINALVDKQDSMMDELLKFRAELGNGLTVRVIETVREEMIHLTRRGTIAISLVGLVLVLLQVAFKVGWI